MHIGNYVNLTTRERREIERQKLEEAQRRANIKTQLQKMDAAIQKLENQTLTTTERVQEINRTIAKVQRESDVLERQLPDFKQRIKEQERDVEIHVMLNNDGHSCD